MKTKEEYILERVKVYVENEAKFNKKIKPLTLLSLIDQWKFDYEMDKEYRPEILK